jgi:hypothetical protein
MRNRDLKGWLRLGNERTPGRIFGKTIGLEIVNGWIFRQDSENECQDIMEGSAPSETEEITNSRLTAMDVGALTILGTFAPTDQKSWTTVINLDRLVPYEGTTRDERP